MTGNQINDPPRIERRLRLTRRHCKKKKGKQKRFPFFRWAVWAKLLHADGDLFRLSLFGFGNMYFENAVAIRGVDSILPYGLR
jgi:hypothetical protein